MTTTQIETKHIGTLENGIPVMAARQEGGLWVADEVLWAKLALEKLTKISPAPMNTKKVEEFIQGLKV